MTSKEEKPHINVDYFEDLTGQIDTPADDLIIEVDTMVNFTGTGTDWAPYIGDLSPWNNQNALIRFRFTSDGSVISGGHLVIGPEQNLKGLRIEILAIGHFTPLMPDGSHHPGEDQ